MITEINNKIKDIEELTKLITPDKTTNNVMDLVYKKCQELRNILKNYYIE